MGPRVFGLLVTCACRVAGAQPAPHSPGVAGAPAAPVPARECPSPPGLSPWTDRVEAIRQHGELPQACLKALMRECSRASEQAMLDGDQAITCSIRYEALLRHGFGGDFEALLAWWRADR